MPQSFLAAGEKRGFVASLDDDDAIRVEARLGEGGRKQVRARDAPQDLSSRARGDAGGEEDRCSSVQRAGRTPCDLVQGGKFQTLARKSAVDCVDPERKRRHVSTDKRSDAADVVPKLAQERFVPHSNPPSCS